MKYQTQKYPNVRVRRSTYERIIQLADASGGSYADVIARAIELLDATGGGLLPGFIEQYKPEKADQDV